MYSAKILKDSLATCGSRLTTMEVTFPRIMLAEFNTHRVKSRNSASSRAIPVEKMIKRVTDDCFIPIYWGKNEKGMQANSELSISEQIEANEIWIEARDNAINSVRKLLNIGVHKQIANRLLEPFMWQTVICSATSWDNFFNLRCDKDAQPEIRKIATMMQDIYNSNTPNSNLLKTLNWHLPLIEDDEFVELIKLFTIENIKKICVGRCARVSYLTHDGKRDPLADIELADRLLLSGHMSPFEHAAIGLDSNIQCGNFTGWKQYRKFIPNESIFNEKIN
jgi:thymidylate synthase ThyX